MNCFRCGAPLSSDEAAVYRRMVNRSAKDCLCIDCFAKEFGVTEDLIREKIVQFKKMGCTLFAAQETEP